MQDELPLPGLKIITTQAPFPSLSPGDGSIGEYMRKNRVVINQSDSSTKRYFHRRI
jgi:hypothetical protein